MDMSLKNVTAIRSVRKNARTVTRRVTKKMSAKKNMTDKNKGKRLVSTFTLVALFCLESFGFLCTDERYSEPCILDFSCFWFFTSADYK